MKISYLYKKASLCTVLLILTSISGCKKYVDVDPPIDSIPSAQVFNTDAKADAVVRGIYVSMVSGVNLGYGAAITAALGLSSDELTFTGGQPISTNTYNEFFINAISSSNATNSGGLWNKLYSIIYVANATIEGINASTGMSDAAKTRYLAEVRFIRAACYFYLVNMYGDVPLITTSAYVTNAQASRTPLAQVYSLIIDDLKFAQANLAPAYLNTTQRLRANRFAASALLARVYLYNQDYVNAEAMASDVIDGSGTTYSLETNLANSFLLTSKEVILQIEQPATNLYTWDGYTFAAGTTYYLSPSLLAAFETGDLRKTNWAKAISTTLYSPYKYRVSTGTVVAVTAPRTESLVFLRLSEMYLIRAEARAQQTGKLASAITDIDVVRFRAGITKIATTQPNITQSDLLIKIAHERYVELFAELGHRWMDLKRTGQADVVLAGKPNWRATAKLFPVPYNEINLDNNLVQNPGYN